MRSALFLFALSCLANMLSAQNVYTIKADSVKLTSCDSSELIIENHTQNVPGFLFNKGNGRTVFKRGAQKINDSLYLIGADTLNLKANSWVQGGNAFGTTGILGTKDNNHVDLYTNHLQRIRLTNTGDLLIGTTTDNGNKLQVNGSAGIGSATITNAGNLIGTNAVLFNHVISQFHNYTGNDPFISQLGNVFYNYKTRLQTTTTTDTTGGVMTIDIVIPPDEINNQGLIYPQGVMCFSFWNNGVPQSVSVMERTTDNVWHGPYASSTNMGVPNPGGGGPGFFEVQIPPNFAFLVEAKITITPSSPGAFINLQNIEYLPDNGPGGLLNGLPFVGKYQEEHIYAKFYLKNAGVDNVQLSPYLSIPNYFLNSILVGSATSNGAARLQVTGDVTTTGKIGIGTASPAAQLHTTGSVRFAGLTSDTTKTRVIVSDANGTLYYRDASTLAANRILYSSLAVNGTISAQRLKLSQTGWPDYVFDGDYHLPSLAKVERYIQQNGHLPGMPSAEEVEKNGIDVGGHQAALLKKIEELTLYNIAQDKELKILKLEVAELKKLIENKSGK